MLIPHALHRTPWRSAAVALLLASAAALPAADLGDLSLEQLLDVTIVSATRSPETLLDAPATVVVITRSELAERGYTELSQVLDDLPGMQVIRPWGATFYRNYWRGYRNSIGDPFLLLLDGMVMNHLYYNTADVLAALPLSSIERVEVVYGPSSSVYGANAFMGVINVISREPPQEDGSEHSALLAGGGGGARLADVAAGYRRGDLTVRVAARLGESDLSTVPNHSSEYARDRYLTDRRLWGGFLDNASLAGPFASAVGTRAVDLRLGLGTVELGLATHELQSGYGLEYAADRAQPRGQWIRPQLGAHLRAARRFGDVHATTLLRYRTADVDGDSYWVEGFDDPTTGERRVQLTAWQSLNSSWSVLQDFQLPVGERLQLAAGLAYERKDLQKAYDLARGPALPPNQVDAASYPYPDPPADGSIASNRITTEDLGGYLQGRLHLGRRHLLHLGLRSDDNSEYGGAVTVRAGWTARRGAWIGRALFGEGFQEPTPRLLYGGWTGSGSDPDLRAERSRTFELGVGRTTPAHSLLVSVWTVDNRDTIVSTAVGAENLGEQRVSGVDLHLQARVHPPGTRGLRLWAFSSHLLEAEETRPSAAGRLASPIGDLAHHQVMGGATAQLGERWLATLRGRWVDERRTVATNPVARVPGFATLDAALTLRDAPARGITLTLVLSNLTDETYAHPGVREASAGVIPGAFADDGRWHGSAGYFSSLLPQPGRSAVLGLRLGP